MSGGARFRLESSGVFVADDQVNALRQLAAYFGELAKALEKREGGPIASNLRLVSGKIELQRFLGTPSES